MPSQSNNSNPYANNQIAVLDESRGLRGVDLVSNPQDLTGSDLLQADNLVDVVGQLYVRPGRQGLFGGNAPSSSSSSSSGSLISSSSSWSEVGATSYAILPATPYDLCELQASDGTAWMLLTAGGKVYKTQQGSGCHTELLTATGASYTFDSPTTDCAVMGDYAYLVDGNSQLARLNLEGGFPAYAMVAPTAIPNAILANKLKHAITPSDQYSWVIDDPYDGSPAGLFINGNFTQTIGGQTLALYPTTYPTGTNPFAGFFFTGPDVDFHDHSSSANPVPANFVTTVTPVWCFLDDPGEGLISDQPIRNAELQGQPGRYANQFYVSMQYYTSDTTGQSAVQIRFQIFSDLAGTQLIVEQTINVACPYSANQVPGQFIDAYFTFPQFYQDQIASYKIGVYGAPTNNRGNGVFVAAINIDKDSGAAVYAPTDYIAPVNLQTGTTFPPSGGIVLQSANYDNAWYGKVGGQSLRYAFGGLTDWSKDDRIVLTLAGASDLPAAGLSVMLGFGGIPTSSSSSSSLTSSSSSSGGSTDPEPTIYWSNPGTVAADGSYVEFDISTAELAAARAAFTYIYILFTSDLAITYARQPVLTILDILSAGNLSIGLADYFWNVTETTRIDASNAIESNPSPSSPTLTPTPLQAMGGVTLPSDCPKNPSTNYYTFYRTGGAYSDARLVATVPANADVAYGSDASNPYYGWDHTTRTFTDNTPDGWLELAALLAYTKDPMPANAQAVAAWQGRLCAAVGNLLYISWLYNVDNSAPLMTTLVNGDAQTDPNILVEGAWFPLSPDPTDTVVRLVPFGTPVQAGNQFGGGLLVLNKRSVGMVQGTSAGNFTYRQYDYGLGIGLAAFRGVARISANLLVWAASDRLHFFPPNQDTLKNDIGYRIQPALYPAYPVQQVLQNQTAFSKMAMLYHNSALYVCAPMPGDTANSVVWKWDFRVGGWTRWVNMALTSGRSMPPNSQGAQYELYFYGIGGNLYLMAGTTDIETPLSAPTGILWTVQFHGYRPGFFYRFKRHPLMYRWARLEWIEVEAVMNGTLSMTAQAYDIGPSGPSPIDGAISNQTYELAGLGRGVHFDMPPGLIEGEYATVSLSGTTTEIAYIRGVRGWVTQTSEEFAGGQ